MKLQANYAIYPSMGKRTIQGLHTSALDKLDLSAALQNFLVDWSTLEYASEEMVVEDHFLAVRVNRYESWTEVILSVRAFDPVKSDDV